MTRWWLVPTASFWLCSACGGPRPPSTETETSGVLDDTATGSVGTESMGDSSMPDGEEPVPARAISITEIEANPGVAIPLVQDGAWVAGDQRNAAIPKNRDTMIRVYVDVDEASWIEREIEARLRFEFSDGTRQVFKTREHIASDSSTTSLQSNLVFGVTAEHMRPGTEFVVDLWEASEAYDTLPPATRAPRAPAAGPAPLGVEAEPQEMRIVLVPIDYAHGDCSKVADTSAETIEKLEDAMFQQNPLESLDITIHEPMQVRDLDLGVADDFFTLLTRIQQLRSSEQPDPNVYYYGHFDNCGVCISQDGSSGCLLGVAPGTPGDSQQEAYQRAAIGTHWLSSREVGIRTFVHEIGHTQGRRHVACPGQQAAGVDTSYPYEEGAIGTWGFGIRDFKLYHPTGHSDYMSYCQPTWVSDWQWNATFHRIRELTSWDYARVTEPTSERVLVGSINTRTDQSTWWVATGSLTEAQQLAADRTFRFRDQAQLVVRTEGHAEAWSEGPMITVRTPLPESFEHRITAFDYDDGQTRRTVAKRRVAIPPVLRSR